MTDCQGLFVVFESASKCGKTTLVHLLAEGLSSKYPNQEVITHHGALSESEFAQKVKAANIEDLGYSTAFYWSDIIFHTIDTIRPALQDGKFIIHDRYDLSIVAWREIHGYSNDMILQDEYLNRGFLINPDLTVYLDPQIDVVLERIRQSDSSLMDLTFLKYPERFTQMQDSIQKHLLRLNRNHILINTSKDAPEACQVIILDVIQSILRERSK